MVRLRWTGPGLFVDHARGIQAQPGIHDVPDELVEEYLNHPRHDSWERVDAESDDPGADDAESFDAEAFIDGHWRDVQSAIEAGEADGHLDAVRAAEQARDGGPREKSVIDAIDSAQNA